MSSSAETYLLNKEAIQPVNKVCSNCIYWNALSLKDNAGDCRYNPPVAMPYEHQQFGLQIVAMYPPVTTDNVACGKFERKRK